MNATLKKSIALFVVIASLFSLLPQFAFSANAANSGTCGESATWSFDEKTGTLTIAGTGKMYDYMFADIPWYAVKDLITKVQICEGITHIGTYAFYGSSNLKTVSIPASVTSEFSYDSVFYLCDSLAKINVAAGNPVYSSDASGVLYNKAKTKLLLCPAGYAGSYSIPNTVTEIGSMAFNRCFSLTNVVIPNSVTAIKDNAFYFCTSLKNVYIPNSVTTIENSAFQLCTALTSVNIPSGVTVIEPYTFSQCVALRSVSISENVTAIGNSAFFGCTSLVSLVMPKTLTSIGKLAFANCDALTDVFFAGDAPTVGQYAFCLVTEENYTFRFILPNLTLYYKEGAEGWTSPTWNSYPTACKPFADIKDGDYFYQPILWAVENGITNGTSDATFSPDDPCTRAQVVTFLWRANGCPEPTQTETSLTDLSPSDFYYKAVLWAVENGITNGTSATTFSPNDPCTRAQVATFLWRAEKTPAPATTENPFSDIISDSFYYDAVLWAVENGITNGMSADTFAPEATCTRGQIVTFLYRALSESAT